MLSYLTPGGAPRERHREARDSGDGTSSHQELRQAPPSVHRPEGIQGKEFHYTPL